MSTVAFGESTMSRTQVQLWYNRFKEGREEVNDDNLDNRRIAIREVANDVSLSFGACRAIFTNVLDMKRVAVKIGSKIAKF